MRKGVIGALALLLLGGGFYASPYISVHGLKVALKENDREALSDYIDFPLLRENLKSQFNVMLASEAIGEVEENPFGSVVAAFAGLVVDKMVDAFVTPDGLAAAMRGDVDGATSPSAESSGQRRHELDDVFADAEGEFDSLSRFTVRLPSEEGEGEVQLVFRRRGLRWMLTNIALPQT